MKQLAFLLTTQSAGTKFRHSMLTDRSVNASLHAEESSTNDVRTRILDAARHHFSSEGYAATSLRRIAEDAGVTKPMVYYYFGSKAGLYGALFDAVAAEVEAALEAVGPGAGTPRQRLTRLAGAYLGLMHDYAETLRLALSTCGTHSTDGPGIDLAQLRALHTRTVASILADAHAAGEIRSVDADLFATLLHGAIAAVHHDGAAGSDAPERIVDILWEGIARPRGRGERKT